MNTDKAHIHTVDAQGAWASWEEPHLPLAQRVRKHWRRMLVHLWGPAGSLVFHVVAIGMLLSIYTDQREEYGPADPFDVPIIHKDEPIEPPNPVTPKSEVQPPDPIKDPNTSNEKEVQGLSLQDTPELTGGSGVLDDGDGIGRGPASLPNKGFDINVVNCRLKLIGLNASPTAGGTKGRLNTYVGEYGPRAAENERTVLRSLRWLKREQQSDGAWIGSKKNVPPAMTAMALLAYLAHGETADSPEFGLTVRHGIEWLMANQESDGHFKGRDEHDYTQPIAAYALCEAYGMTGHLLVKEAAIKAISLVVQGQNASGGFNYNLDQSARNDSSYMAWCCQALKAARMAKLMDDVPGLESAIKKGIAGFKINAGQNGGFGYANSGRTGLSGAGALCMQLLGAPDAPEVLNTIKFLDTCTFSFATPDQQPYGSGSQVYYWYYITQAKFHHSKETFQAWNRQFSPELCRTQQIEKNAITGPDGKPADVGHWESPVKGEHTGGLVQDTALCTLMLEVYYRYLPTFKHMEIETEMQAAAMKTDDASVR